MRLTGSSFSINLTLIALLFSAQAFSSGPVASEKQDVRTTAATAPTLEQLRGAKVRGIYKGKTVQIKNGVYEGASFVAGGASHPRVELLSKMTATGNLDNLPGEERVALLAESSGGSGTDLFLAVFGLRGGKVENLGTVRVGDRVQLRVLNIMDRTIVLDVVEGGPNDPACCPTQAARLTYALENGALKKQHAEVVGKLSVALLAGAEWTVVEIDGKPLAATAKRPTAQFEGERIAGFGGCNRYTAPIKETGPGKIAIGPIAGTRMACPESEAQIEDRFLASLGKATQYTFLTGQLLLSGLDGNTTRSVLFARP